MGKPAAFPLTYDSATITAGNDILAANIAPDVPSAAFRITVALELAVKFQVKVTDGTTPFTLDLNNGAALPAGTMHTFSLGVRKNKGAASMGYNFTVGGNSKVRYLAVEQIDEQVI